MKFEGRTVAFDKALWVQHGDVAAREEDGRLVLEPDGEAPYLKVLNHFGRIYKVFTFEDGRWIDTDTGETAAGLDEAQAGRLRAAPAGTEPAPAAGRRRRGGTAKRTGTTARASQGTGSTSGKRRPSRGGKGSRTTGRKGGGPPEGGAPG